MPAINYVNPVANKFNFKFMLITPSCVDRIKEVPIDDVIGHFIKITKKGANYSATCPFHGEKTGSFMISPAKDIYKCFGCGAAGDAINFVREYENKTFAEACEVIAGIAGIQLEYEQVNYTEQQKAVLSAAQLQEQVLNYVIPVYRKKLLALPADHPARVWLYDRGFDVKEIQALNLGWAGHEWNTAASHLINKGWHEPATRLGLIKQAQDKESYYDGYRSRIVFPITDRSGRFIGLGGRYIKVSPNDSASIAKYINPADCEIYNKSVVLYGLSRAAKAIKQAGFAIVVEGYMDVDTPHSLGIKNVVGTCGTAFTASQMRLLKKHTGNLVMMLDNDSAGKTAFQKALPMLLKEGFRVDVAIYPGKDPDEFFQAINNYRHSVTVDYMSAEIQDALNYRITEIWEAGNYHDDVHAIAEAKTLILELIAHVKNQILQKQYLDRYISHFRWKSAETIKQFAAIAEKISPEENKEGDYSDEEGVILPDWVRPEEKDSFLENGFIAFNKSVNGKRWIGYYTFTPTGKSQITNFLVYPLFHVYAGVESRYLLQIDNGNRKAVLDVPAKNIPSPDQFQAIAVSEGPFMIFGSKTQWLRIASELLQSFPRCIEINSLGWQSFSFFAWVNKVYVPGEGLKDLNNWGIIKHKEDNFLVPASCEAYRQLVRTGEDPYENDRYLTFKESPVSFSLWAKQMHRVYPNRQGLVAIAYTILSMFRDVVFEVDNNCPHLYAFGEPSSGKSKWAESITAVFYYKRPAFNVNSGTDFAFFNYLQRYVNCPAHLNEVEIETIKPEWFQAIKGAFDGEGRERGKGGSKNRTEIMRVKSTLILTGQKLITADDNSVVTRSIIEPFSVRSNMEEDDRKAYEQLKAWELHGMSSMLVELLAHRDYISKNYKVLLNEQLSDWRRTKSDATQLNQRILQNYAHLATGYNIMSKQMVLPESAEVFTEYCYSQAIKWSGFIRSSDTLSEFWHTLEFLVDQRQVTEGWDYSIETMFSLKIRKNKEEELYDFKEGPKKVLFIRLNNIHKQFQMAYRQRTGKEAMNMENLLHYFSSRRYYIGPVKRRLFKRFITTNEGRTQTNGYSVTHHIDVVKKEERQESSCYAFLYDDLDIQIDRVDESMPLPGDGQQGDVTSTGPPGDEVLEFPFPPVQKK